MRPVVIAHRGYSARYPENTLLAFRQAARAGADRIELDVHFTADHQLVVHHEYTIKLPGQETCFLSEISCTVVQGERVREETGIPCLSEVFDTLGCQVGYELELKGVTEEFLCSVLSLVRNWNLFPCVEFTSPHPFLLTRLRELEPWAKLGLFVSPFPQWMSEELGSRVLVGNLGLGRLNVAHCPLDMLTPHLVAAVQEHQFLVHASDCNTESALRHAFELGVDQVSTNEVELAITLRNQVYATVP